MPQVITDKDGNLMIDHNTFDSLAGQMYNQWIIDRDGLYRETSIIEGV